MDKLELFKLLLNKECWENYKYKIDRDLFPDELHDLFDSYYDSFDS